MSALSGKKTYMVAIGVILTGLVQAGIADPTTFSFPEFWDYLLGGAGLAALRNGIS